MERSRATLTQFLLFVFALAVSLICGGTVNASPGSAPGMSPDRSAVIQINPSGELSGFYEMSDVQISVALVVIPDPRIPRHRRAYDNAIAAINQGMLRQNFVLDRFGFPWQFDPQQSRTESIADKGEFGLMLFRQDRWRDTSGAGNTVIALYVVPEAGTYGVQTKAFKKALVMIDSQIDKPGITAATFGRNSSAPGLAVIGPTYSGTLDSIRQIAKSLPTVDYWDFASAQTDAADAPKVAGTQGSIRVILQHIQRLDLVSSSNTVASNARLAKSTPNLSYQSYAVSDDEHARTIARLIKRLNIPANEVAFLLETSVFGQGFCAPEDDDVELHELCSKARRINFPANIADVRFGIRQKQAQVRAAEKIPFSPNDDRLNLEDGAENGSEFPESYQSPLTAVSSQLVLDAVLDSLGVGNAKVVVVIATDVRDRLFLFEQLRAKFSKALLIDLATDRLLAHPDFLHASRGALSMASAPLQICRTVIGDQLVDCVETSADRPSIAISAWSTDDQELLADIVADLNTPKTAPHRQPTPHLVTHHGLVSYQTVVHREREATWIFAILLFVTMGSIAYGFAVCLRTWRSVRTTSRTVFNNRAACLAVALPILLAICASTLWITDSFWLSGVAMMISAGVLLQRWDFLKSVYSPFACALVTAALVALIFSAASAVVLTGLFARTKGGAITELMGAVNAIPALGMSYYSALVIALLIAVFALFSQINLAGFVTRNSAALATARSAHAADTGPTTYDSHLLEPLQQNWPAFIFLAVLFLAAEGARTAAQGFKVTPFGAFCDGVVWLSVIVTLLFSLNMLLNAIGIARRLLVLGRCIRGCIGSSGSEPEPLLWIQADQMPAFASSPILTVSTPGGSSIPYFEQEGKDKYNEWVTHLTGALCGKATEHNNHLALYALLASEMFLYQRAVFGVALCSLASAAIVYFYPVSDAEILLLINLGILLVTGIYSGYATVRFESDVVLSNVLCNRPSKPNFSVGLIGYVAFPFAILAIVIAITDIPGVLDWGGGLMHTVIGAITPGILK